MIQRLVAVLIILTITACTAVSPKEVPVPVVKKAPVQKKGAVNKSKSAGAVSDLLQAQRQDGKYAYDAFDNTPIEILPDEILIVGRIKLSPPLQPEEQMFQSGELEGMQDKAIMVRSIIKEPLPAENDLATADTFKVSLDQDFLLTLPHSAVSLLGGYVYISGERGLVSSIQLPGSWQLGIREDDHAIYIGTIHYVRSEYDTILDYIIEDNYPQAYEAYQHRLQEGIILRKQLVEYTR